MSPRVLGWALLGLSLLLFGVNVLRLDPAQTGQGAHWPWPDGAEYLDSGLNLAREGRFVIHVAGDQPPRYPFGFPVLIAVSYLLGAEPTTAAFRVNEVLGLGLLLGVFALLAHWGKVAEGGLAALLLASMPALTILARSPMSDLSGTVIIFGATAALVHGRRRSGSRLESVGAFLLGLSVCFRLANVYWAPLIAATLLSRKASARDLLRRAWPMTVAFLIGVAPLITYNFLVLGGPLRTGYGYWLGGAVEQPFHWGFLGRNLAYWWKEVTQSETAASTAFIYGQGSYFGPASIVLLMLALPNLLRRMWFRWFAAASAIYPVMLLFYLFPLGRLYLTCFVLALTAAAVSVGQMWRRTGVGGRCAISLLLLVVVVGYPGRRHGSDLSNMLITDLPSRIRPDWVMTQEFLPHVGPEGGLVLTDLPPPFVHAFIPQAVVAPLEDQHDYRFRPEHFRFASQERNQLVARARSQGQRVFVLSKFLTLDQLPTLVPPPRGWRWRIIKALPNLAGTAELIADPSS